MNNIDNADNNIQQTAQENAQGTIKDFDPNTQQNPEGAAGLTADTYRGVKNIQETVERGENNERKVIETLKDRMPEVTPTPPAFHQQATAHELKARLMWGEPGLTIVDVRDREVFNQAHIMGAITMPMERLLESARIGLMPTRDIYVYGSNDEETSSAANTLRQAGFRRVAELKGGIDAWTEIRGAMEGPATDESPSAGAYNLMSRLQEFAEERAKEKQMERLAKH